MNMPNMNAPVIPPPILPGSTHIVRLQEAVTMEELSNDEEYNDIMEDMQEECAKVRFASNCMVLAWYGCISMSFSSTNSILHTG